MVAYEFTDELINVDVAMAFAESGEAGARVFRGKTWSELIYIFCRRARAVEAGTSIVIFVSSFLPFLIKNLFKIHFQF